MSEVNEVILKYAYSGSSNMEICHLLLHCRGLTLSPNAVKKRLRKAGFPSRRGNTQNTLQEIKIALKNELQFKPRTVGYRFMTDLLTSRGFHVRRNTIMTLMREIDPEGVEMRRRRRLVRKVYWSRGPNHTWHMDGYDKLKPYGFAIHGCIDGFSRKIMWLKVASSNNNPRIVANFYIKRVQEINGCPKVLQADPGTENVVIGALQSMFRGTFRISRSTFNQRIEAWWSMLKRRITLWWIYFFKDLVHFGELNTSDDTDLMCIRYCFTALIQKELDEVAQVWNHHYISRCRQAMVPNGRPFILYSAPESKGAEDCIVEVSDEDAEWAMSRCDEISLSGAVEFDVRADEILRSTIYDKECVDWTEALEKYFYLKDRINSN